ncbi:MAG: hypothetical protein SAL07_11415 [Oscillatoria sp. PMC 1051.18]|uniref:hypothetical protein n=1 Tax=Oscillatoria salina TaxID=331517 RepID=UPI001CCDE558|nr:hypothetical protein [Oscillatoria salina]MEC4895138.1 hypothetical protein [Oscillatoria sp. PMC 1050.18]MEC5030515.1 hypothetical protein [Oscillatoria sp. PMC 1051.18]
MAKRRNLKKEKASRNQAYARQFGKKSYRSFSKSQRFSNSKKKENEEDEATERED